MYEHPVLQQSDNFISGYFQKNIHMCSHTTQCGKILEKYFGKNRVTKRKKIKLG